MATIRLAKLGISLILALVLGGCMSARSPEFVEAASQDFDSPPTVASIDTSKSSSKAVGDSEPAIFSEPDTSLAHRQKLGDDYSQQILKRSSRSTDTKLQNKLQRIVSHLSQGIEGDQFTYRVYLLTDPRPNAFTTGGGHLFITTGLVAALRSEGQVAAVIAHEMAHNASAHVVKGAHGRKIVKETAAFSENVMHQRWGLPWLGNSIKFLVSTSVNKYTREQEDKADALGLRYIIAAGYDPHEAARAVKSLVAEGRQQSEISNFFFGRHSTARARIWRFGNLIKAYFPGLDSESMRRSTDEYNKLATPYWNAASSETAVVEQSSD